MASNQIARLKMFKIGKGDYDWAIYTRIESIDVEPGTDLAGLLKSMDKRTLDKCELSRDQSRPERFLDIPEYWLGEKRRKGGWLCRYAFHLDAEYLGVQRLRFVKDRPFIPLELNSKDGESFLDPSKFRVWNKGLCASFDCDLDEVRSSKLAKRILKLNETSVGHRGPNILNIPFAFNVVDPLFKASPWAVPGHSLEREHHDHSRRRHKDRTHGGVHPSTSAFLSVEL